MYVIKKLHPAIDAKTDPCYLTLNPIGANYKTVN